MLEATSLDEDKPADSKEFAGATLQINDIDIDENGNGNNTNSDGAMEDEGGNDSTRDSVFTRNTPGRSSIMSRTSRTSRISLKPGYVHSDKAAELFYSYKESQFERAINNCKCVIKPELDGDLQSSWLLTEIDHWDMDREKIILLTENSMFVIKYNFINQRLYEHRRIMLHIINSVSVGDFKYPNSSLMPDRKHGGIKISWHSGEGLTFGQKWNPWASDIPWCTLSSHPVIYNPKEKETITYNVDEFLESLIPQISKTYSVKRPGESLKVIEGPVVIESYASPLSMVFNQSSLGYFKDRNGVHY